MQEVAFEAVKRGGDNHKVRRLIDYNKPDMIWRFSDASPTVTGAWIGQGPTRDAARPAAFHTKKLTPSQSNYPTHEQETLAIIEAMEAFAPHLGYRQFTVATDHKSLTKLMTQKNLVLVMGPPGLRKRRARRNSPPGPAERPGAGHVFEGFPAPAPGPACSPDWSPLQYVQRNDPIHAMSGTVITPKITPPACC